MGQRDPALVEVGRPDPGWTTRPGSRTGNNPTPDWGEFGQPGSGCYAATVHAWGDAAPLPPQPLDLQFAPMGTARVNVIPELLELMSLAVEAFCVFRSTGQGLRGMSGTGSAWRALGGTCEG
jgi:hypothetical protein